MVTVFSAFSTPFSPGLDRTVIRHETSSDCVSLRPFVADPRPVNRSPGGSSDENRYRSRVARSIARRTPWSVVISLVVG